MLSALLLAPVLLAASNASFSALADEYWEQQMRLSPLTATFYNHPRYHERLDDNSAEGRADEVATLRSLKKKLSEIDLKKLDEQDKVSAEVMRALLDVRLEWHEHRFWEFDVDHMDGPQSWIPSVVEVAQPMSSKKDAGVLLTRMQAFPQYFARHVANLREGMEKDRFAAGVPVDKTLRQLDELLKQKFEGSPFAAAAGRLPAADKKEFEPKLKSHFEGYVKTGYKLYADFLRQEYQGKARRDQVGISAVPGGDAAYKYQIKYHTTVDVTADELHKIGLQELDSIWKEIAVIAKGDPKAYLAKMRKDPANFFKKREDVLKRAEELVAKSKAKLPAIFGVIPKTPLVVKPVEAYKEKNETAARYYPPPDDLSRPGIYYINTYKPESRARYTMTSLAVHEGVPGHHMQIALASEQRGLPAFRRQASFTAYIEGWALYSERLADELGLYEDDLSKVGMLTDQAWRACRLVVDTGLHAKGWSRQKAIDFMTENTGRSAEEVTVEIDRYIIWPGQALAYKVGQRELEKLRKEASQRPGFDLRKFHDDVLRRGALPLPLLRKLILN